MFYRFGKIGFIFTALALLAALAGCSGLSDTGPMGPTSVSESRISNTAGRVLWGYYEISADPVECTVEITTLRQAGMHLNAIKYLETPTSTLVSLESAPKIIGGKLVVDIGIKHPLPQDIYTGFDVRGILITRGSVDFGGGIITPGYNDLRLANADGYTRFWNPTEFSGYQDGILGTPHSIGNYNSTVNGFKYFADGLGADDSFWAYVPTLRGAFTSGSKNVRRYELKLGPAAAHFNYAVDASWAMPGSTPPTVPDDFNVKKANSIEAWRVAPDIINHLSPGGGECSLEVNVYDWQGGGTIDEVSIQAPGLFTGTKLLGDPVDNGDYISYSIEFTNELGGTGKIPALVTVTDTGAASNQYLNAYQLQYLSVPEVVVTLAEDTAYKTPGTDYEYSFETYNLGAVEPPFDYLDFAGPWDFTTIDFSDSDHRTIFDTGASEVSGFKNDFPANVEYFVRESESSGIFRAEEHNEASGSLYLHGIYYGDEYGAIVFGTPAKFPYPVNKNTNVTVNRQITIIPFLLTISFEYHTVAIGQGWVKVPIYGGSWHNCLLMRSTVEMSTGGALGTGWIGTVLQYEYLGDNGILAAQILTANTAQTPDDPGFDDVTFEIIGNAEFMGLQDITNF